MISCDFNIDTISETNALMQSVNAMTRKCALHTTSLRVCANVSACQSLLFYCFFFVFYCCCCYSCSVFHLPSCWAVDVSETFSLTPHKAFLHCVRFLGTHNIVVPFAMHHRLNGYNCVANRSEMNGSARENSETDTQQNFNV